jgi:predicted cobalt transporter CbtA
MEIRVILRGALAGVVAGVFGFLFAKVFAEPQINKAIAYESGRDKIIAQLNRAAGRPVAADGPEIFSRHIQSTIGVATGIIAFSIAMGALVAVVYLVLHGRFKIRPRTMALLIAGFGFVGVYLLPFVKYPANPPAIGHSFTIDQRSQLYLAMVGSSIVLLIAAVYLGRKLQKRVGTFYAVLIAGGAMLVVYSVLLGLLPQLGNLAANVAHQHDFGYARAATETPQPITNLQGQIVYPGFPADVLWQFRWDSVINQLIVWTGIGLLFGFLLERLMAPVPKPITLVGPVDGRSVRAQ